MSHRLTIIERLVIASVTEPERAGYLARKLEKANTPRVIAAILDAGTTHDGSRTRIKSLPGNLITL